MKNLSQDPTTLAIPATQNNPKLGPGAYDQENQKIKLKSRNAQSYSKVGYGVGFASCGNRFTGVYEQECDTVYGSSRRQSKQIFITGQELAAVEDGFVDIDAA